MMDKIRQRVKSLYPQSKKLLSVQWSTQSNTPAPSIEKKKKKMEKKKKSRCRLALGVLGVGVLIFAVAAGAKTINVPGDHLTIQAAINAASGGDTINVAAGTYTENVDVNKSVFIVGSGDDTIVEAADGNFPVIDITANEVSISKLKVTGGKDGIYLDNSTDNTLTGNTCSSNSRDGIHLDNSTDNTLTGNTCSSNSRDGIHLDNSTDNTLTENTITNNPKGISIDNTDASTLSISFNSIYSNTDYGINNEGPKLAIAINNWWGANDGPSTSPGSSNKISDYVDGDPWLVLSIIANPASIVADGSSTSIITSDMTKNSDGQDTSSTGTIPDGTVIIFTTTAGSLGSTTVTKGTTNGKTSATLTSSTNVETATVTASAPPDGAPATVSTKVSFTAGPPSPMTLTADPVNITANGDSTSTLTATVKDQFGRNVPDGTNVTFTTDHGALGSSTVIKQTSGGVATATLTSESSTETVIATIIATANGASGTTTVFFIPEGDPDVEEVESKDVSGTGGTIPSGESPTGGEVTVSGSSIPEDTILTVAKYTSNPGGTPTFKATGDYWDTHLNDHTGVTSVTINFSPVDPGDTIHYWDGASWYPCSDQTHSDGSAVITITDSTSPDLSDLSGLVFGKGYDPILGEIVINDDATFTNSRSVTLTLSANNAAQMQFSNDAFSWSDWEDYATEKSWTLTSGDGTKTVYVRFKDSAGNVSETYSDNIILDTTPPTVSITSPSADTGVDPIGRTLICQS